MIRRSVMVTMLVLLPAGAWAQGEPPVVTDPSLPAGAGPSTTASGGTDHALVIKKLGIQGIVSANLAGAAGAGVAGIRTQTDVIGVRYWFTERIGMEAGVGIAFTHGSAAGGSATSFGFGFGGGMPIALGVHKHITTFVEPFIDMFIYSPPTGSTGFLLDLRGDLGFEWQLGFPWLESPTLAFIFKVGAGVQISKGIIQFGGAGDITGVAFNTNGASVGNLLAATGGFVFYL